jgi:DNA helicase-2/ATP-dependent DNA helicase PcrA
VLKWNSTAQQKVLSMTHSPTAEQQAILDAVAASQSNLLISALAGAAKTSTLVMIANGPLRKASILFLAFNKAIAVEAQSRLPDLCTAMTLNSLGQRAWGEQLGKKFLKVDKGKNYRLLKEWIGKQTQERQDALNDRYSYLLRAIEFGKSCGYIPSDTYPNAKPLMGDDDFYASLEEEPSQLEAHCIREITLLSLAESFEGIIDFSDQLLMPTVFACSFPQYPIVMVDEAQDLSALNHAMLRKIAKRRLIAVGDACQAIYGFRGAHKDSMELLKASFNMTEYTLSISFRCPRSVVKAARWRAPHMQWADWAPEGAVKTLEAWELDDVPREAAILCRNNAPLFSTAIKFLAGGRFAQIVGNDVGATLLKTMQRIGKGSMQRDAALARCDVLEKAALTKSRQKDKVRDEFTCIRVFLNETETLSEAVTFAERIFNQTGPVKLMTGHKSKGLEFDHVFILDRELLKPKEGNQDANLHYVMQTRAKETLTYLTSDLFAKADMDRVKDDETISD